MRSCVASLAAALALTSEFRMTIIIRHFRATRAAVSITAAAARATVEVGRNAARPQSTPKRIVHSRCPSTALLPCPALAWLSARAGGLLLIDVAVGSASSKAPLQLAVAHPKVRRHGAGAPCDGDKLALKSFLVARRNVGT